MSASVSEWQRRAKHTIPLYEEQYRRYQLALREHRALEESTEGEVPAQFDRLVSELLPDLQPASLARVQARTGNLEGVDPEALLASKRRELEAEVAEIEADLGCDLAGARARLEELAGEVEDQARIVRPLRRFVAQAKHERLDHLLEVGYGQPRYDVPWYRLSYYSDWKAGDEILEAMGEVYADFAAFREDFAERSNQLQAEEPLLLRLEAETAQLNLSVARVEELQGQLLGLPEWLLGQLQGRLREDLSTRGEAAFTGRTTAKDEGGASALAWVGLGKRVQYLQELRRGQLEPFGQNVEKTLNKLKRKSIKYWRPKHSGTRFSEGELDATFADKTPKWDKFWARYEAAFAALRDFDGRYHYGRFDDDFLWWDMFCDGRVKGRFSEEVVEFYEEYEDYSWESPWDDDEDYAWEEGAAAAAIAEADGYDEGDLFDGS